MVSDMRQHVPDTEAQKAEKEMTGKNKPQKEYSN